MAFEAGVFQTDMVQGVATSPKVDGPLLPFPPASTFLSLSGLFLGHVESSIRTCQSTKKMILRFRCDADVTVTIQRRAVARWGETIYTGSDIQHLFAVAVGEDLRLVVDGVAEGRVELVDENRQVG